MIVWISEVKDFKDCLKTAAACVGRAGVGSCSDGPALEGAWGHAGWL